MATTMEELKRKAKAFLFDASHGNNHCMTLYKSKDLQRLLDMNDGELFFIYNNAIRKIIDNLNAT